MPSFIERVNITDAIKSENVDLLKELLQTSIFFLDRIEDYLNVAIVTGNIDIFQILMEKLLLEGPVNIDLSVLYNITYSNHGEDKKLKMVQRLMPYVHSIDSNSPRFNSYNLIKFMEKCCNNKNFILAEFLINKLYSEDRNKLYPLIEKLRRAVGDGWHYVCILLHDCFHPLCVYNVYSLLLKVVEIFFQLLLKDTRESMELAVETFQELLDKNFYEGFTTVLTDQLDWQDEDDFLIQQGWNENISTKIIHSLSDSLTTKLLFQLIYNSINGKTQEHIYQIMESWLNTDYQNRQHLDQIYNLSCKLLFPFISNPRSPQNGVCSLKMLTRDVIRNQVFQNVNHDVKKFMDRIWEFKLPTIVKCFVLHIPDPAWMGNRLT